MKMKILEIQSHSIMFQDCIKVCAIEIMKKNRECISDVSNIHHIVDSFSIFKTPVGTLYYLKFMHEKGWVLSLQLLSSVQ
jgi:hypothetical protein